MTSIDVAHITIIGEILTVLVVRAENSLGSARRSVRVIVLHPPRCDVVVILIISVIIMVMISTVIMINIVILIINIITCVMMVMMMMMMVKMMMMMMMVVTKPQSESFTLKVKLNLKRRL